MISSQAALQLQGNKLDKSKIGLQPGQRGFIRGVDGKEKFIDEINKELDKKENQKIPNCPLDRREILAKLGLFVKLTELQRTSFLDNLKSTIELLELQANKFGLADDVSKEYFEGIKFYKANVREKFKSFLLNLYNMPERELIYKIFELEKENQNLEKDKLEELIKDLIKKHDEKEWRCMRLFSRLR